MRSPENFSQILQNFCPLENYEDKRGTIVKCQKLQKFDKIVFAYDFSGFLLSPTLICRLLVT